MAEGFNSAVTLNRFGYYELEHKPTMAELDRYYSEKYYQEGKGHYSKDYSEEEIRFFRNKLEQKLHVLSRFLPPSAAPRLLDIGAGEGFALSFFKSKGWRCTGIDYSDVGCRRHNPDSAADLVVGDIPRLISDYLARGERFDVVWLDNVLEHLLDPLSSLRDFSGLVAPGGLLVLEVPNDFSVLQETLLARGLITRKFWIAVPDHISYFNRDGLVSLCREAGWSQRFLMGDFPIDFNLFNPATNYVEDRSAGRGCHMARVAAENLLHGISVEKTVELFRQYGELGLGRQIIGFFQEDRGGLRSMSANGTIRANAPAATDGAAEGVLRPLADGDLEIVLRWRNLPEVRRNMFTTHEISWAEHSAWWSRVQADPTRCVFVFCQGGEPLGVVNYYDIDAATGECYWGFYMAPASAMGGRNRLSVWLDLEEKAAAHAFGSLGVKRLLCETMAFNTPVLRIHEKFGFRKVKEFQRARDGAPEGVILMGLEAGDFRAAQSGASPAAAAVRTEGPAEAKAAAPRKTLRVAFLGSANWDLVSRDLSTRFPGLGGDAVEIVPVPFGQYRTLLFDEASALRTAPIDYTVLCERFEDLLDTAFTVFDPTLGGTLTTRLDEYLSFIEKARQVLPGRFLVLDLAPLRPYSASLQDAPYRRESQRGFVETLNETLQSRVEKLPDTHVLSLSSMLESFGARNADPGKYWYLGRMAFSGVFGKYFNSRLAGAMLSLQGRATRALVLDLDNTLWGGVIGDDGIQGIQLGTDFPGNVFLEIQNAAIALKNRGIALAICSKNTESVVVDAFSRHPEMRLKLADFAATRINWESKASNLAALSEELGLGLSSMCFIDDSPYERDAVRRALPDLLVPELPEDVSLWPDFILSLPQLAYMKLTPEDLRRAEQYQTRARINSDARSFENKEDFWRSLGMRLHFQKLGDVNLKRTVQLLSKTNQFNTTTRRHGEMDLRRLQQEGAEVVPIALADKYSQPEIVGVIILQYPEGKEASANIETFLLSCRVLGRSVETGILGWACSRARDRGYRRLEAEFIETPRNQPAAGVYPSHGFAAAGAGKFALDLEGRAVQLPEWFQVEED